MSEQVNRDSTIRTPSLSRAVVKIARVLIGSIGSSLQEYERELEDVFKPNTSTPEDDANQIFDRRDEYVRGIVREPHAV